MSVSRLTLLSCALAIGAIAVCSTRPALAISEAQRAYNACVDSYNSKYRSLGNYKAIVAGLTDSSSQCFWTYDAASEQDAINRAMNSCRQSKPRCFLYASTSKHSSWSQRISDLGGSDGSNRSSGGGGVSLGNVLDVAGAIVGGVAAARGGGGGYSGGGGGRVPAHSGYSQKGAFDDCAAVYSAAGDAAAAAKCRQRSSNMGSIR